MLKKTINFFCLAFALVIVACPLLVSVSADGGEGNNFIDFNEYATYTYSDDNSSVIADVAFPDFFNNTFISSPITIGEEWYTGNTFTVETYPGNPIKLRMYPISGYTNIQMATGVQLDNTNIIDLRYIPNGSTLNYSFVIALSSDERLIDPQTLIFRSLFYVDKNGLIISESRHYFAPTVNRGIYTWSEDVTLNAPTGAVGLVPMFWISNLDVWQDSLTVILNPFRFVLPMSALEFESMQNQQIKNTLNSVQQALDKQGQQLDNLPGEIGDEFQGVIEQEKAESAEEGNKFVDQVLDKLPDPSTEVLGSLKKLTDSMSYTGTECRLKIPAIVLPAVDGLFPETEIWGGADFSFSDYLAFLPPNLLVVVQSLFTIAIVLYCVYELKGIISYCLTLNDKKGV